MDVDSSGSSTHRSPRNPLRPIQKEGGGGGDGTSSSKGKSASSIDHMLRETHDSFPHGINPIPIEKMSLKVFDFGKKLGQGKFGKVYLVKTKTPPAYAEYICALKVLNKKQLKQYGMQVQLRRE